MKFCNSLIAILILFSCNNQPTKTVTDPDPIDTISSRGTSGKLLFQDNCAPCHAVFKEMSGPAMDDVIEARDSVWIYKFLTDRKSIKSDSLYRSYKKKFDFKCQLFPSLSQGDVVDIIEYVKES